ncbi:hypothetical protein FZEAL_7826 [Fusarium zealandicum]|uniref:Uncharacterized protein n=1 Tax=Fusarium zealandicum TaxID=1053134 RepID=A0A8H4UF34_9HYPO|nr:hypothetical protein FZEAL_7826 [Fusarium zealandicum]
MSSDAPWRHPFDGTSPDESDCYKRGMLVDVVSIWENGVSVYSREDNPENPLYDHPSFVPRQRPGVSLSEPRLLVPQVKYKDKDEEDTAKEKSKEKVEPRPVQNKPDENRFLADLDIDDFEDIPLDLTEEQDEESKTGNASGRIGRECGSGEPRKKTSPSCELT